MKILNHQLVNLPVETHSGQFLGRISHYEIDVENHQILKYYIKSDKLIAFLSHELIIDPKQVISITNEKMVVQDNIPSLKALIKNKTRLAQSNIAPAAF